MRLDGSGPFRRYDGFGAFGLSGLVGELIFHRHGPVHLGELTSSKLLGYRLEQLAWAKGLFVEHFYPPDTTPCFVAEPATGSTVTQDAYHVSGLGYTITGRIGVWRYFNVHKGLAASPLNLRMRLALNPSALFDAATLVLGDLPAHAEAPPERLTPLGKVLRAACPQLISPAALWVLSRDEACFLERPPRPPGPAAEIDGTAPLAAPTPHVSKRTGAI